MVRDYQFHGLRNADDILICLDMFDGEGDSILDFPHGSGWSFTKFYFTQAWLHGWRLGQYSNLLLNIFIKLRKSVGLSGHFEIPMQYFCATIEFILKEFGDIHIENPQLSEEALAYAIQQSGYIDSELVLEVNAG